MKKGADSILVVSPDFWGLSCDPEAYYGEVLGAGHPALVYQSPGGYSLGAEMISRLAESHRNLAGIKTWRMGVLQVLKRSAPRELVLAAGNDRDIYDAASQGFSVTSGWSNCFPGIMNEIFTLSRKDRPYAWCLQSEINSLLDVMNRTLHGAQKNPVAYQKAAAAELPAMRGIEIGAPRYPDIDAGERRILQAGLSHFIAECETIMSE
jgi:dihydrodipicolinate synthase/N-acetylneuraminate lyase